MLPMSDNTRYMQKKYTSVLVKIEPRLLHGEQAFYHRANTNITSHCFRKIRVLFSASSLINACNVACQMRNCAKSQDM